MPDGMARRGDVDHDQWPLRAPREHRGEVGSDNNDGVGIRHEARAVHSTSELDLGAQLHLVEHEPPEATAGTDDDDKKRFAHAARPCGGETRWLVRAQRSGWGPTAGFAGVGRLCIRPSKSMSRAAVHEVRCSAAHSQPDDVKRWRSSDFSLSVRGTSGRRNRALIFACPRNANAVFTGIGLLRKNR